MLESNMKTGKSSLADKIAGILNTAPSSFDPEENTVDDTNARVLQDDVEDHHEDEEILSSFRRANVDLLADFDDKYAGRKTSRKKLTGSISGESDDSIQSSESSNEEEDYIGRDEDQEEEKDDHEEDDEFPEEESELDGSDVGDDDEDDNDDDTEMFENDISPEDDTNFKHLSETNISNQLKKGVCVRNQMAMWENLLEVRIQLQKCLITANKMPQKTVFNDIKNVSGSEFINKVNETKTTLCQTLEKLMCLRKILLKQFSETKNLDQQSAISENHNGENDEEIPSDTENEESEIDEIEETSSESPSKVKRRKLEQYEADLAEQHKTYKDYRNSVIQKWNDKTRIVVKGNTTSHSILDQIEYNLSNKDKLVRRTQLKRSQYEILGENTEKNEGGEYNTEIYDDDDFYHQLLRELIEVKSADVTDPIQLGRQWIQLQNLRSKMKRKIDTRATKGRKIRYTVHNKLVNFMAPIDKNLWTDEAKNELYNSLFGKNQPVFNA